MRVYKTKDFARFARKERIEDDALCKAIDRAERGLVDADLGGGVIKQRVPRKGQGRSGGYRTIVAYRVQERSVFIHGFAKSSRANLDDDELAALKGAASRILAMKPAEVEDALETGTWIEVDCDQVEVQE